MARRIVLEGRVYCIASCDCWCFTLLDRDPTLDELVENYRRRLRWEPTEREIEDWKVMLMEHEISCFCRPGECPGVINRVMEELKGRKVRITIEVLE